MRTPDIRQIIYALERARDALDAQAESLLNQHDYNAEFPAADAECMREAIDLLEPVARGVPLNLQPDPMDTGLPCDVKLGCVTFGKGVPLRLLADYARRHGPQPVPREVADATLARLRGEVPLLGGEAG